jgi:hypothetical protein
VLRTPAPLTAGVRPSFPELSGSQISDFRKALESWFGVHCLALLTGFNARRTCCTAHMGSYFGRSGRPSVLRQPAHHRAAPKCHKPSSQHRARFGVAASRHANIPQSWLRHHCQASSTTQVVAKPSQRLAHCSQTSKGASVQHHCSSNHGQFAVCSAPSPSRPSLTVRSTRTQPRAMPSAFSWPLLVPSAQKGSGAGYLGS